jgi:hypothetical protein
MAERVIAKAVEAGNGEDVAKALRYRDEANAKGPAASVPKQQACSAASNRRKASLDDMTMHLCSRSSWLRTHGMTLQGRDEDSAIVIAIDQSLAKDGYNSQTEEYWDELRKRSASRLPEKFKNQRQPTP